MSAPIKAHELLGAASSSNSSKSDNLVYDLGNLAAFDAAPISKQDLQSDREEFLRELARDNVQLLVNRLFSLDSQPAKNVNGRLVSLPPTTTAIPREKPVPKPRAPTKWEVFAKTKGIQKRKRGRMVWDEKEQTWKPRYGYKRANDESNEWVLEHKSSADPEEDPWTTLAKEKKERVKKNKKQRLANLQAASGKRLPGTLDLAALVSSKKKKKRKQNDKKAHHVDVALAAAQKSTASMGVFDAPRRNEPKRATVRFKTKSEKAKATVDMKTEKQNSLSVLSRILDSDGGLKSKAPAPQQDTGSSQHKGKRRKGKKKKGRQI